MWEMWKTGSSLDGSGGIFTRTSFRNKTWQQIDYRTDTISSHNTNNFNKESLKEKKERGEKKLTHSFKKHHQFWCVRKPGMVCICYLHLRLYPQMNNSADRLEWSRLTDLYILYCVLDFGLKSLSEPEEVNCLTAWVRRRKSLKRKAYSSLLLLVLNSFPLWRSFRGPRQLVKELKTRFYSSPKKKKKKDLGCC